MAEKGAGSNDPVISNITGVLGQLFNRPKTEYIGKEGEEIVVEPKQSDLIFISKCKDCKISIKKRAAKCIVNDSSGIRVELQDALMSGTLELIDCQGITLTINPQCPLPTLSAERCKDIHLHFHEPTAMGSIYTIQCHSVWVYFQLPHTEKNELSLPAVKDRQYVTRYKNKAFSTVAVVREGGGYATTEEELMTASQKEAEMRRLFEEYIRNLLSSFKPTSDDDSLSDDDTNPFSSNIEDEEEKKEYFDTEEELGQKLNKVAEWAKESQHTIVFTGAGISTSSGIPDYRSGMDTVLKTGPGVWELVANEAERPEGASVTPIINALPSPTHMAIVQLQKQNMIKYTVSQNIDGLHRRSGLPPTHLAELHGNTNLETCQKCRRQYLRDFETREAELAFHHATSRHCDNPECDGVLMDSIINFGEALPEQELTNALKQGELADLCIVLGSSLRVQPASRVPLNVHKRGGKVVICNLQKIPDYTPDEKTMQVFAKCDEFMEGLCQRLGVQIPPFVLHRRARVTTKQGSSGTVEVTVTGLDTDEDIPYSFIKTAATKCDDKLYEISKEPLVLTLPCVKGSPPLTIQCQGHYGEPTFQLECPPIGEEQVYRMDYEVLAKKKWVVTKE